VKPNLRELSELVRTELEDDEALVAASRYLIESGQTEIVALTLGDFGALLVTRKQVWRAHAPEVKFVSAVGAGDSFLGALLWGLVTERPMPEAVKYAVAAGAAAVQTLGTALCEREDVESLLSGVRIETFAAHDAATEATR
jgi:6-phosphofructokinase 2